MKHINTATSYLSENRSLKNVDINNYTSVSATETTSFAPIKFMSMNKVTSTLLLVIVFNLLAKISFAQTTETFNYNGTFQTLLVPAGVTTITVDLRGARGGSNAASNGTGGFGGRVVATVPVTPSETLRIYVGQAGAATSGGWNGGAASGATTCASARGGFGGGATDIRRTPYGLADRLVVAGGGGGAGGARIQGCGPGAGGGGGGGYFGGGGGGGYEGAGGGGGTQSAGGAGGLLGYASTGTSNGTAGTSGNGGAGGGAASKQPGR
jgi:hypothetical protein